MAENILSLLVKRLKGWRAWFENERVFTFKPTSPGLRRICTRWCFSSDLHSQAPCFRYPSPHEACRCLCWPTIFWENLSPTVLGALFVPNGKGHSWLQRKEASSWSEPFWFVHSRQLRAVIYGVTQSRTQLKRLSSSSSSSRQLKDTQTDLVWGEFLTGRWCAAWLLFTLWPKMLQQRPRQKQRFKKDNNNQKMCWDSLVTQW